MNKTIAFPLKNNIKVTVLTNTHNFYNFDRLITLTTSIKLSKTGKIPEVLIKRMKNYTNLKRQFCQFLFRPPLTSSSLNDLLKLKHPKGTACSFEASSTQFKKCETGSFERQRALTWVAYHCLVHVCGYFELFMTSLHNTARSSL